MKRIMWAGLVFVLAIGIIVAGGAAVRAGQRHPEPFHGKRHIVMPGETLWKIVESTYPNQDPREEILSVERVNHLRTGTVYAGQRLLLPADG